MSARVPIALAILATVLLGYILAFERGTPSRTEVASRRGFLVERFVRDRLTGIRIASGDVRVVLRREGEGFDETWTLEAPNPGAASPEAVEDYVRNWEFAVPVRTLQDPSPDDVTRFGVDTPKGEVRFEIGRATVRATLGTGTPVDGGGYVRIDDEAAVHVVGDDVVDLFARTPDDFALAGDAGAPLLSDLEVAADAEEANAGGTGGASAP